MQACNLRIFKKLRDMITIIFTQNSLQFLLFFQFSAVIFVGVKR